jgi:serine/threonine protein kinase
MAYTGGVHGEAQRPDAEVAVPAAEVPSRGRIASLLRSLTSRRAIVTVLPGLVAAIAAMLLLVGRDTLRRESLASARTRLKELTEARAWALRGALAQSEPVLTELRRLALFGPPELAAQGPALVALLRGRPTMAYVSVSYPDGTFRGAYLDEHEALRFQESVVLPSGGVARHFRVEESDGRSVLVDERKTDYDPRTRSFYTEAAATRARIWTAPYAFFDTRVTGVTRAAAVWRHPDDPQPSAVLTVDFDVAALSRFLTDEGVAGATVVLYTRAGELLAFPSGAVGKEAWARREGRPVRIDDLTDPVLRAFFAAGDPGRPPSEFRFEGEPFMTALADASDDPALGWTVAYVAPERLFLEAAERYQARGLIAFAFVVALSLTAAVVFAVGVTRTERRAQEAEAKAERLGTRARELGSYRLVARLGRGGMGEVWRAEHRLLAREAAIKLIRPDAGAGDDAHERKLRFRREAEALSQLRSRNTIEILDYGIALDGTFYYVMELLDGLDFETLVSRYGPQRPGRVVKLLLQVCASLAEAHDRGLVHRDVKPANLFVCRAADEVDIVKVLDFGLVRTVLPGPTTPAEGSLPRAGQPSQVAAPMTAHGLTGYQHGILGTPGFMAPEQVLGRDLDGRADLFALGCVAFYLLTGKLLFDDPDHARRSAACLQAIPDLRERLGSAVPDALAAVVMDCLARKRGERPRHARALAVALRRAELLLTPDQQFDADAAGVFWREVDLAPRGKSAGDLQETRMLTLASSRGTLEQAG